jgi:hypothetical protein
VRGAFAELLIEESLLHVAVFEESLRPNRDEMKAGTASRPALAKAKEREILRPILRASE